MNFKILICGLPGSGKTTLAKALIETFEDKVTWFNADAVRTQFNDWDFSEEGRKRQALRMNELCSGEGIFIADFVAPTKELRSLFNADFIIFMNTIKEGRFEDTNKIFESPENDYHKFGIEIKDFTYDVEQIKALILNCI